MTYQKINNIIGWLVFVMASAVYILTLEETTSLWDCGEYITTANKLEVGHPPGAPFFMMLGRLFSAFASPENAAYYVNMVSALSSSASILFLFWTLTMLSRKLALKINKTIELGTTIAIMGTGVVGALAYTFTDSFWFSAVEGEVYAMSSFFTAIVFWAILKWEVEIDRYNETVAGGIGFRGSPDRWIIFIAYMIGLSIGVHLLNLLAIPAIAYVIYFKSKEFDVKSFLISGLLGLATLGVVQAIIIPKSISVADVFERTFKTTFGLPFNTGTIFFFLLIIGLIYAGIKWSQDKEKKVWNTAIVSLAVLLIGYSSFTMIVVRSKANTPLDENNPESLSSLVSYLNRDQYGSWPVLNGPYWNSPHYNSCEVDKLEAPKEAYMRVFTATSVASRAEVSREKQALVQNILSGLSLNENYVVVKNDPSKILVSVDEEEKTFMNQFECDAYLQKVEHANKYLQDAGIAFKVNFSGESVSKYINTFAHKPNGEFKVDEDYKVLFPRMYRPQTGAEYKKWCGYKGDKARPLPAINLGNDAAKYIQQAMSMQGKTGSGPNGGLSRADQYEALVYLGTNDQIPPQSQEQFLNLANELRNGEDGLYLPSKKENFVFFRDYQLGWMYWRYFLWNFAGRQNDTQGYGETGGGSQLLEGNWISGVNAIDQERLGSQDNLPSMMTQNKGYNKYFYLPLILGIIGFIFQLSKAPKDWFVVLLLFLLTGIAIVIYLNQKPAEPRERDYAYAASFYAFSIWIGLGVFALFDAARNMKWKNLGVIAGYSLGAGVLLYGLEVTSGGSHALSYSILFMSGVAILLHVVMMASGLAKNDMISGVLATGICLVVPYILAEQNWDDHDRSNRTTARDFAYNYLMSCDPNAILFTNGDNDTFPLWYIQEVEGVRTDVRVANMSLLSTDWHINQMKKKAYDSDPLPIHINEFDYRQGRRDVIIISENPAKKANRYHASEAINFIMNDKNMKNFGFSCNLESYLDFRTVYIPVDKEAAIANGIVDIKDSAKIADTLEWRIAGNAIYKADLAVLDLLANYKWDRPIYFASLAGIGANKGILPYMQVEGMTYKLTPIKHGNYKGANTNKMYDIVMKKHTIKKANETLENVGFEWGNMKGEGVLVDYYTMRMVGNLRMQMVQLSDALIRKGEKEKAVDIIDVAFREMPVKNNQVPADYYAYILCKNYYEAGAQDKGDSVAKILINLEIENLKYYQGLEKNNLMRAAQNLKTMRDILGSEKPDGSMVATLMSSINSIANEDDHYFALVFNEWSKSLNNLEMLREASLGKMGQEEMFAPNEQTNYFKALGCLDGTEVVEVMQVAKDIFTKHAMILQNTTEANRNKYDHFEKELRPYLKIWGYDDHANNLLLRFKQ